MLACDFAYAVPRRARFALTEITLGIMPGAGGTQTLPRAVGERRAKEIILTGKPFSAEEALAWGLVNRLCAPGSADGRGAGDRARDIAPTRPWRCARPSGRSMAGCSLTSGPGHARSRSSAYNRLVATEDRREGIRAFNEKRQARFTGTLMDAMSEAAGRDSAGRGFSRDPRGGAPHLRGLSRRLLARAARSSRTIPTEFVARADQGGLSRRAHSRALWRRRACRLRAASVILEEIHAAGCNAGACHAQMYIMGTLLRHGSDAQKQRYLPKIAARRIAAPGLRRDRAHAPAPTRRKLKTRAEQQRRPLRRARPEGLDLARAAFRPDAAAGAHHAGREGGEARRRAVGVPGRSRARRAARASRSGRCRP